MVSRPSLTDCLWSQDRGSKAASNVDRVVEMRMYSAAKKEGADDASKPRGNGTPPRTRPGPAKAENPAANYEEMRKKRAAFLQQQARGKAKQAIKSPEPGARTASQTPPRTCPGLVAEDPGGMTPPPLPKKGALEPEPEPEPEPETPAQAQAAMVEQIAKNRRDVAKELRRAQKKFNVMVSHHNQSARRLRFHESILTGCL